jgi:hypothetical protein
MSFPRSFTYVAHQFCNLNKNTLQYMFNSNLPLDRFSSSRALLLQRMNNTFNNLTGTIDQRETLNHKVAFD